jgi:hypothetical protein
VLAGLSLKVSVNASRVRDPPSLQAQLATQYQYSVSLGLDYTLGSIFSSLVNAS